MNEQLPNIKFLRNEQSGVTPDDYDGIIYAGMLFFNAADNRMWVYGGSKWVELNTITENQDD